jgi:methanogenesis imperfect marker protein 11
MLTHDEILAKTKNKPWVSPFEKIVGLVEENELISKDNKTNEKNMTNTANTANTANTVTTTNTQVQIYEYHARNSCYGAAAWAVYHYKHTSPLVLSARRDGARDIFTLKVGKSKLNLKPSYSSAGIEHVKLVDNDIHITYSGLAGGGVGSSLCRGLAKDVKGVIIHSEGGGEKLGSATLILPKMLKLQVGVDDTDKIGEGATWSLANEIGHELNFDKDIEYLNHTLVQLYPGTPEKTTNCVATVLTFGVKPNKLGWLKKELANKFHELTSSKQTGLAFLDGIRIPKMLEQFAHEARSKLVTIDDARNLADRLNIELHEVTGDRGLIGATAALGFAEKQDEAVEPAV